MPVRLSLTSKGGQRQPQEPLVSPVCCDESALLSRRHRLPWLQLVFIFEEQAIIPVAKGTRTCTCRWDAHFSIPARSSMKAYCSARSR
jgi:hypothetical protein